MADEIKAGDAASEEGKPKEGLKDADATALAAKKAEEEAAKATKEPEHLDYKTLYEDEKKRREGAEAVIQRHAKKPQDKDEDEEEIQPSVVEELDQRFEQRFSTLSAQLLGARLSEIISKRASSPEEANLIRFHYENSIRPSGDVELDVENAHALANKGRMKARIEELAAAVKSKETTGSGSGSGRKLPTETGEALPPLTPADQRVVEDLRRTYVLPNDAVRRIMAGESLDMLIQQGIVKKIGK